MEVIFPPVIEIFLAVSNLSALAALPEVFWFRIGNETVPGISPVKFSAGTSVNLSLLTGATLKSSNSCPRSSTAFATISTCGSVATASKVLVCLLEVVLGETLIAGWFPSASGALATIPPS